MRFPTVHFRIAHPGYVLQPFLCHPVLAGDSLDSIKVMSTAAVKGVDRLGGHWLEHMVYYVKLTDFIGDVEMTGTDAGENVTLSILLQYILEMLLDPANARINDSSFQVTTDPYWFTAKNTVPYVEACLTRVVETYWRLEGEGIFTFKADIGGKARPIAPVKKTNWLDSARSIADLPEGFDLDLDVNADAMITASEALAQLNAYQRLLQQGATTLTYEEWLKQFGVKLPPENLHIPELLAHWTSWKTPSITVNPSDGATTQAVVWNIDQSMRKRFAFREPGFIFGVTCQRRKEYFSGVAGTVSGLMNHSQFWLPDAFLNNPAASLLTLGETNSGHAIMPSTVESTLGASDGVDVMVDMKDLLLHGEDYFFDAAVDTEPVLALPAKVSNHLVKRFPTDEVVEALPLCCQDGVVMMSINSSVFESSNTSADASQG